MSKSQLQEKTFLDGVMEQIYEHLMDGFNAHAHTIGFPELALPATLQMKKFVKQCKVSNYTKQIKQILDKVQETSKVITLRRKSATITLANKSAVDAWEKKSKEDGTPLGKYYTTWRKLRDRELQHQMSGRDDISMDNLPVIERSQRGPKKASEEERKEFADIFDSDSEDSDDETRFMLKEERPSKKQKVDENLGEFTDKELEKLAGSASEDDDDDDSIEVESDDDDDDDSDDDDVDDDDTDDLSDMDDDGDDKDDIVEDFQFSSDDDWVNDRKYVKSVEYDELIRFFFNDEIKFVIV